MYQGYARPGQPTKLKPTTLPRVAQSFAPYRPQAILTIALVLFSALLGLATPLLLRDLIDHGLKQLNLHRIVVDTSYTILATVLSSAAGLGYGYLSVVIGQKIMRDLRDRLFDHLQGMSLRFFTSTRTGEIQSRLANDVSGVQSVVSDAAANVLNNVTVVVSTIAMMIYFDWRLTLLSIGIIPIFAVFGAKIGSYGRKVRAGAQAQLATLNSVMQETLSVSGALLTKTTGRRGLVHRRFVEENESLTAWQIRSQMIMRYFMTLMGLTFTVTPTLIYWLAGHFMFNGDKHLTIGVIVAFTSMQARVFFPLTNLMNTQVEVMSSLALFDRIYEYLDLPIDILDAPDAVTLHPAQVDGRVTFRDVSFSYEAGANPPTLSGISFQAEPGQLVALVGPSGAGKTSLTYMIPRLYDVDSGSVEIDGHDVRKIKLESIGEIVGMVTQETYLVHDTIRENLRYGRPDATDAELEEAARAAAIHDTIARLPEGYDTTVGERGYKFSGGEKQRIAIARAILKNPRILILDEATSALDTHSERAIQAALEPLMHGRTTFAIAHRLSTILEADLILVMVQGRVVERGTHGELIAQEGVYARLYREQFQQGDPGPSMVGVPRGGPLTGSSTPDTVTEGETVPT